MSCVFISSDTTCELSEASESVGRMADAEKPFVCSSSGCNMSFTNEDQLMVHKKKHDMILNLGNGSKSASFVADQTPTPTRFIRNCEEVGLFQDLQNVNPFEETFRRAVEAGNTGTLTVLEAGITDDTLHTPHIFPHIADVLSANSEILSENSGQECAVISISEKHAEQRTTIDSDVCRVKLTSTEGQDLIKDELGADKNETLAESIINQAAGEPKILSDQPSPQLSINGEEVQLLLKTADGKLMHLSAIPLCEPVSVANVERTKQQTVVIKTEPPLQSAKLQTKKSTASTLSLAKMKLKQVLTKSTGSQNQKPADSSAKDDLTSSKKENRGKTLDQEKKKEILERNRASSMRARAKRKAWIQELKRTVANVNETNAALQMEIKALRAEVAKLKTLLLAHKDCPVTKAMQKGNGIVLGPKIISLNPELLTTPAPLSTSVKRQTSFTDVPIVPKKKLSSIQSKNPIIFPKVDCATNLPIPATTLIKSIPTLKIMGINQFLTEKEDTRQILILQNSPRKVGEASSRQVIQINPNYEVEHAASKTTGA